MISGEIRLKYEDKEEDAVNAQLSLDLSGTWHQKGDPQPFGMIVNLESEPPQGSGDA
ncbi:hypothetical protein SAMN05660860_00120 [Geoalkalibacter ferrihydriticus]|uniref:Uncharacterized protein n=1 Tax=Geoalkalibacter ferrihydriticus TaxID=392333 RepID=A0A1G9IFC1_9BACT|nr:hypothetical protein [Geoalkalibacter ferrihydriticus]SDL23909.1 hypothetical protein SAMN05660860_00120 [Geoalkalibacter ferrihydriticus]